MYGLTRRSRRVPWDAQVRLCRSDDLSYQVRLRDISRHGCLIELVNRIPVGGRLWINLPGLMPVAGVVRWENDFSAGVDFETPLNATVLARLVNRKRD